MGIDGRHESRLIRCRFYRRAFHFGSPASPFARAEADADSLNIAPVTPPGFILHPLTMSRRSTFQ
jgi:hypothetical protein